MIPFVDTDVCCYVASMLISLFWLWCHMMDMTIKNSILCRACSAAFAGHNMFVAFYVQVRIHPGHAMTREIILCLSGLSISMAFVAYFCFAEMEARTSCFLFSVVFLIFTGSGWLLERSGSSSRRVETGTQCSAPAPLQSVPGAAAAADADKSLAALRIVLNEAATAQQERLQEELKRWKGGVNEPKVVGEFYHIDERTCEMHGWSWGDEIQAFRFEGVVRAYTSTHITFRDLPAGEAYPNGRKVKTVRRGFFYKFTAADLYVEPDEEPDRFDREGPVTFYLDAPE